MTWATFLPINKALNSFGQSTFPVMSSADLLWSPKCQNYYHRKNEAQRGKVTCLRSHKLVAEWELEFEVQQHGLALWLGHLIFSTPALHILWDFSCPLYPSLTWKSNSYMINHKQKSMHNPDIISSVISKNKPHVYGGEWREKLLSCSICLVLFYPQSFNTSIHF